MAEKPFDAKFVDDFTLAIAGNAKNYEIASLHAIQGAYIQRIFNDHKATDGSSLGKYRSFSHKAKRLAEGRQISEKDLEFYGDLRRSIRIGTSNGINVMGFATDLARLIAEGQTGQIKKQVFQVSDAEINEGWRTYTEALERSTSKFS